MPRLVVLVSAAALSLASAAPANDPYAQGGYQPQPYAGGGAGDATGACQHLCARLQQCQGTQDQDQFAGCTQECVGLNPDPGQVNQLAQAECGQLLAALGNGGGGGGGAQAMGGGAGAGAAAACQQMCGKIAQCQGWSDQQKLGQCQSECVGMNPDPAKVQQVAQMDCAQITQAMGPGAGAGAGGGGQCPTAEGTGDARLFEFLTRNAWCYESYRGGATTINRTEKCRAVLERNGRGSIQCGGETYSTGQGGTYSSSGTDAPQQFCWKLDGQNPVILVGNGAQYQSKTLKIEDNGYGVLFVHVGKDEYRACN
jgi:hypothetical protein